MKQIRLMHDPGHGSERNTGTDCGGIHEKDLVLEIATDVRGALSACRDLKQSMTRIDDRELSFKQRAEKAEEFEAELVIIYHVNAMLHPDGSPNPDVDGLMVFVPQIAPRSREIAEAVLRAAPLELQRKNPHPYVANPNDWTRNAFNCMAQYVGRERILVELGFATSPTDLDILRSEIDRPAICASIAAGVARFMQLVG